MSPWLDFTLPTAAEKLDLLEAQTDRRFIKTHLPVDALVFSPRAKYIYIGRDGRDVVWSFHNHHANFNALAYEAFKHREDPVGPPLTPTTKEVKPYFMEWMEKDGYPWWPFWENIRSWWDIRHLPNVMLVHFEKLKQDMPSEMRRMAAFLDIPITESRWPTMVEHCTFDYMKAHADHAAPVGGLFWEGGGKTFVHKGTNGRWRDLLTAEESRTYEQRARKELGDACAHWLATADLIP